MAPPGVLVVGETPSLGRSIVDLLEASGVSAHYVDDIRAEEPLGTLGRRYSVVVAASNTHYCATARQWATGELPDVALVVVGSRDPFVTRARLQLVPLPLLPARLLGLVRSLLDGGTAPPGTLVSGSA
ncbi:MAG TPA: hypothetical protein VML94_05005 [Thermoplasmata archaeon]|nr:hypothetical protein [Thermoplasmata archaeon]